MTGRPDPFKDKEFSTPKDRCKDCRGTGYHRYEDFPDGTPNFSDSAACSYCKGSGNGYVPANDRQVGGDHYKDKQGQQDQQHWDRMWSLYREAWFVGNITKYVERYRKKDGLKDLLKARHYLDKLIELEEQDVLNRAAAFEVHPQKGEVSK